MSSPVQSGAYLNLNPYAYYRYPVAFCFLFGGTLSVDVLDTPRGPYTYFSGSSILNLGVDPGEEEEDFCTVVGLMKPTLPFSYSFAFGWDQINSPIHLPEIASTLSFGPQGGSDALTVLQPSCTGMNGNCLINSLKAVLITSVIGGTVEFFTSDIINVYDDFVPREGTRSITLSSSVGYTVTVESFFDFARIYISGSKGSVFGSSTWIPSSLGGEGVAAYAFDSSGGYIGDLGIFNNDREEFLTFVFGTLPFPVKEIISVPGSSGTKKLFKTGLLQAVVDDTPEDSFGISFRGPTGITSTHIYSQGGETGESFSIVKTAFDGTLEWVTEFALDTTDKYAISLVHPETEVIYMLVLDSDDVTTILKLDSDGELEWAIGAEGLGPSYLQNIGLTPEGYLNFYYSWEGVLPTTAIIISPTEISQNLLGVPSPMFADITYFVSSAVTNTVDGATIDPFYSEDSVSVVSVTATYPSLVEEEPEVRNPSTEFPGASTLVTPSILVDPSLQS